MRKRASRVARAGSDREVVAREEDAFRRPVARYVSKRRAISAAERRRRRVGGEEREPSAAKAARISAAVPGGRAEGDDAIVRQPLEIAQALPDGGGQASAVAVVGEGRDGVTAAERARPGSAGASEQAPIATSASKQRRGRRTACRALTVENIHVN